MDERWAVDGEQWLRAKFRHSPERLEQWVDLMERRGVVMAREVAAGRTPPPGVVAELHSIIHQVGARGLATALEALLNGEGSATAFEATLVSTLKVLRGGRTQPETLMSLRRPMDSM